MNPTTPRPFFALLAGALLCSVPALAQTAAEPARPAAARDAMEVSLQWAPPGMSNDGRSFRLANFHLPTGKGWGVGLGLGWGDVRARNSTSGLFALARLRYDTGAPGGAPWLRPRIALEYGGGATLGRSSIRDMFGVGVGAAFMVAPELSLTADLWNGSARFDVNDGVGAQEVGADRKSVRQVRFGIGIHF